MIWASSLRQWTLAFILLCALLAAPLLHASIPHYHTSDHHAGSQESAVWTSLHTVTQHGAKKFIFDLDTSSSRSILILAIALLAALPFIRVTPEILDPIRGRYLLRGIAPYRKFR